MKGETQEPNKGFANTRPPAQPTQEKLSNLGLQTSAAPQKTNYKHSALDWRLRGDQITGIFLWMALISENMRGNKYEDDWKTMGFIEQSQL